LRTHPDGLDEVKRAWALRLAKCHFEKEEIEFLGLKIRSGEVDVAQSKIQAILDEHLPKTKRGIRLCEDHLTPS